MANTIAAALKMDVVLDSALTAFKQTLMPLALLATAFYDVPLEGSNKIVVPYYPIETAASKDYAGSYVFDKGTDTQVKEVTVDKRKYQPLSFTSEEQRRQPKFDPEKLGALKGAKLAEDVMTDILSVVTHAHFANEAYAGAIADFDVDDTIDIEATLTIAKWPKIGRGMIVPPTLVAALKKDMNANGGLATFGRDSNGNAITFPSLNSFSFADSNIIPNNGENLFGMAVYQSAILVGFSPIAPTAEVAKNLTAYETVTDPDTGLTLEYRSWGDPDTDTTKRVIECNYGYDAGEGAALYRMVTA